MSVIAQIVPGVDRANTPPKRSLDGPPSCSIKKIGWASPLKSDDYTQNPRSGVDECYGDVTTLIRGQSRFGKQ